MMSVAVMNRSDLGAPNESVSFSEVCLIKLPIRRRDNERGVSSPCVSSPAQRERERERERERDRDRDRDRQRQTDRQTDRQSERLTD